MADSNTLMYKLISAAKKLKEDYMQAGKIDQLDLADFEEEFAKIIGPAPVSGQIQSHIKVPDTSEYHKIETLYERDEKTFKVNPHVLKNPTYALIKTWQWTEKIDGTNIRITWDPNSETIYVGGKTENADIPTELVSWGHDNVLVSRMKELFPTTPVVLYGEGYGPGIQKGGGGYRKNKAVIFFDVLVNHVWWLSHSNVVDICDKLGLQVVPYLGAMTLESATAVAAAGYLSHLPGAAADKKAEGLVGRPAETLFDKKGHRLIVKLKYKDFAR